MTPGAGEAVRHSRACVPGDGRPAAPDLEWPPPKSIGPNGDAAPHKSASGAASSALRWRASGVMPVLYTYPWWWRSVPLLTRRGRQRTRSGLLTTTPLADGLRERVSCHPAPVDRLAILAVRRQRRLNPTAWTPLTACSTARRPNYRRCTGRSPRTIPRRSWSPAASSDRRYPPWLRSSDDEPPDAARVCRDQARNVSAPTASGSLAALAEWLSDQTPPRALRRP